MFNSLLEELVHKVRFREKESQSEARIVRNSLDSFATAELVFQQADRFATLVMYEQSYDRVELQAVDVILWLIKTLELLKH